MITATSISDGIEQIAGRPWHPIDLIHLNDQVVRMALFKGEYHWHSHRDEDELFYVVRGHTTIQMEQPHPDIALKEGEMAVIPKGVEHCPISDEESYVLLFEPASLVSTGDEAGGNSYSSTTW